MSFRLKGLLANQYQSQVEHSYMRADNVITLENVPCEMTFESSSGFMEHESAKHNYLPVFHLMGSITEIRGDFPYHISSLYFGESDKAAMSRDILYYPSPDELAYMIKSGKFYSKQFDIPMVLNHNTYSFPALVNLMIVPPEDEIAYEQSVTDSSEKTGTLDSDTVDKTNLPIVYVGLVGTGVSRKNDPLLDYYGIEMDADFPSFALTAESSGYTDPPLMKYIPEPEVETEKQNMRNKDDYYLSDEEQQRLITAQKDVTPELDLQQNQAAEYYMVSDEDVLVAKADRNISKRVEEKRMEDKRILEQRLSELRTEQEHDGEQDKVLTEGAESSEKKEFRSVIMAEPAVDYEDQNQQQKHPDIMQQQTEVDVDLNPEQNQTVLDQRNDDTNSGSEEVQESDVFDLEHMQGADVSNAEDQAKLEDARVRDVSRDTAVMQQTDAVNEDNIKNNVEDEQAKEGSVGSDVDSDKKLSRSEQAKLEDAAVITAEPDAGTEFDL